MSSANTKVYHCSTCKDNINYNRKQYFKHIKTPDHIQIADYSKGISKLRTRVNAALKNPKSRSNSMRSLRLIVNNDMFQ